MAILYYSICQKWNPKAVQGSRCHVTRPSEFNGKPFDRISEVIIEDDADVNYFPAWAMGARQDIEYMRYWATKEK